MELVPMKPWEGAQIDIGISNTPLPSAASYDLQKVGAQGNGNTTDPILQGTGGHCKEGGNQTELPSLPYCPNRDYPHQEKICQQRSKEGQYCLIPIAAPCTPLCSVSATPVTHHPPKRSSFLEVFAFGDICVQMLMSVTETEKKVFIRKLHTTKMTLKEIKRKFKVGTECSWKKNNSNYKIMQAYQAVWWITAGQSRFIHFYLRAASSRGSMYILLNKQWASG